MTQTSPDIREQYRQTGELTTSLMLDASSAVFYLDESTQQNRLDQLYLNHIQANADFYRKINTECDEINDLARIVEIAVWFGRPDLATPETVEITRKHNRTLKIEDFGKSIFARGSHSLQEYYDKATARGHSYENKCLKALLWGSAGRVLLTLNSKEDDSNITLIFDETSPFPRGGIQSFYGTKKQLENLLLDFKISIIQFEPDQEVTVV